MHSEKQRIRKRSKKVYCWSLKCHTDRLGKQYWIVCPLKETSGLSRQRTQLTQYGEIGWTCGIWTFVASIRQVSVCLYESKRIVQVDDGL